jgi:hypothetical protein
MVFGTYARLVGGHHRPTSVTAPSSTADRLSIDEPLARAVEWHEATWTFTPLGYRPGQTPGTIVPGYPLGLPLVMAAARAPGRRDSDRFSRGPRAGGARAVSSPPTHSPRGSRLNRVLGAIAAVYSWRRARFVHFQMVQSRGPMSDVPAMAWWCVGDGLRQARRTLLGPATDRQPAVLAAAAALLTRPESGAARPPS